MGGIDAVHVQAIVRLGIAEFLGLAEGIGKARTFIGHPAENVVAGAVDDPVDAQQLIGDQALAQGLQHGNAAGHAGLKIDRHAGLLGEGDQLRTPLGQQGLVGGDERFAGGDGRLRHLGGLGDASEEFDHDLDGRVGDHGFPVRHGRHRQRGTLLPGIPDGNGAEFQGHAEALLEQTVGPGKIPDQAGTHRTTTDQTDAEFVHRLI